MTEQTEGAEVALSDIVEDLTDLPLSWDFFPEPDAALDDVARLIRAREAAAEVRGAQAVLAAVEAVLGGFEGSPHYRERAIVAAARAAAAAAGGGA